MAKAALTDMDYEYNSIGSPHASYLQYNGKFFPPAGSRSTSTQQKSRRRLPLRCDVYIDWTQDGREFPASVLSVIQKMAEFEVMPSNWDGYGARALQDGACEHALRFVFETYARQCPALVPLPDGGIGLRWSTESKDLEIDVDGKGLSTGFLMNRLSGEAIEVEEDDSELRVGDLIQEYFKG
jgi:hypothetical protein